MHNLKINENNSFFKTRTNKNKNKFYFFYFSLKMFYKEFLRKSIKNFTIRFGHNDLTIFSEKSKIKKINKINVASNLSLI